MILRCSVSLVMRAVRHVLGQLTLVYPALLELTSVEILALRFVLMANMDHLQPVNVRLVQAPVKLVRLLQLHVSLVMKLTFYIMMLVLKVALPPMAMYLEISAQDAALF